MAVAKAVTVVDPPKWVLGWFIISSLIVCWDTGYIFSRPHSFFGGKWHWLWAPYKQYGDVDLIYSKRFYDLHNGFTAAQGAMNVVETVMNFTYVYLAAFQPNVRLRASAPVLGFAAVIMTFWKTALYWLQDYLSGPKGWGYTGHNKSFEFWLLFFIPNVQWLIFPAILAVYFGRQISELIVAGAGLAGPAGGTRARSRKSTAATTTTSSRRKSVKSA